MYIAPAGGADALARFDMNGAGVRLYSGGNLKLLTRADGVRTYGTLEAANLNVTGVTTAITVDVNGDLDVDGHTNLDNVNIAGITTMSAVLNANGSIVIANATPYITFDDTDNRNWQLNADGGNFIIKDTTDSVNRLVINSSGNVSINNDLDVDGHTHLDNVSVAGITTFASSIEVADSIKHNGDPNTQIDFANDRFTFKTNNVTRVDIQNGHNYFQGSNNFQADSTYPKSGTYVARFRDTTGDDTVVRFHNTNVKNTVIEWSDYGSSTTAGNLVFKGFSNNVEAGRFDGSGNFKLNQDLDVDGHTNLDNVSVAGVTTFSNTVHVGTGTTIESNGQATFAGITTFRDGVRLPNFYPGSIVGKIQIGDSNGYEIFHYNNNNYLTFTRDLLIRGDNIGRQIRIQPKISQEGIIVKPDAAVELYHNGTKRLETTAQGIEVTGHSELDNVNIVGVTTHQGHVLPSANDTYDLGSSSKQWRNFYVSNIVSAPGFGFLGEDLTVRNFTATGISTHVGIATFNNATFHDDVTFTTQNTNNIIVDKSDNSMRLGDNIALKIGDNSGNGDLWLYHDTSNSYIRRYGSGNLRLTTSSGKIQFQKHGADTLAEFNVDGSIDLYYDNTKRFETTNSGIEVTGLTDTDTLTTGNATFTGTITAGGSTGTSGYYLKSVGTGVTWAEFPTARTSSSFTASAGQTTFSVSYTVGLVDVFVNGIKLTSSEFTASNGTSIVLSVGCFVGDIVEVLAFNVIGGVGGGGGTLSNIVEDTTPQLGGNLDLFNKTITGTGSINMTGVVTATQFKGDGSGLTGIVASGSGVIVKDGGSTVGTAGTINFGDNLSVSAISAGIVTITGFSGITTNSGVVSIANDLDVDGHTNLDNVSVSGVTTMSGNLEVEGNTGITIRSANPRLIFTDTDHGPDFSIRGNAGMFRIVSDSQSADRLIVDNQGNFDILQSLDVRKDLDVNGHTNLDNVSIAGVTTFAGNIGGTATFNNIDVDGHTELDNVNIAGVVTATTFKGALEATSASFSSNIDAN